MEKKDISPDNDTDWEETFADVDKECKWGRHKTDWEVLCFAQQNAEQDDAVAEAEDTVSNDQLVHEGEVSLLKYFNEKRYVDEENDYNCDKAEHFFCNITFFKIVLEVKSDKDEIIFKHPR